jgi:hypothetical protein
MKPETRDLLQGISVALLALGVLGLIGVLRSWRGAARAAQWPVVPGVVRHSSLKKGRSMFNLSRSGAGKGPVVYRAQVIYAYRVNGVAFEGRRVRFGARRRERAKGHMQDLVARYPMDQPVQVHYRPDHPADSVLELGLDPQWRSAVALTAALLVLGLAVGGVWLWA